MIGLEEKLGQVRYKKFSWVRLGLKKNRFKKKLVRFKNNQVRLGQVRLGLKKKVSFGSEKNRFGQVRFGIKS